MSTSNYFDNKSCFLEPKVDQYGSNMVMTNVHKPSKKKYLNIDTRFVERGANIDQEYVLNLPERVNDVRSIKVDNVQIPMSFYNVSDALCNNSFYISEKKTQVIIPGGYYTDIDQLLATTNQQLHAANILDVSFVHVNNHVQIQSTSNVSYTIVFENPPNSIKSTFGWLLGFRGPSYIIHHSYPITSENIYNLAWIRYIYIVLDEYCNGTQNSFLSTLPNSVMNKKILARVEMDTNFYPFGTVLRGNFVTVLQSDQRSYNGKADLQKLKLQLVNEWGRPIDLNGLDWSCLLEVEYE
jgi:hypothetical protein